jgi:hypothetical protein
MQERKYVPAYDFAMIHPGLGENSLAAAWLLKAREERSGWLAYAGVERRLDRVRSEPEFAGIVKTV